MVSIIKRLFLTYFKITGWQLIGGVPKDIKKAVLVAGGHTSNWDLIYSVATMKAMEKDFHFFIKKEAMVFPLKRLLMSLGAVPINRDPNKKTNYVDQAAQFFNTKDEAYVCIAPEGTRSAVKKWKTGYYHIAHKAGVPIILCYLDYKKKKAVVGKIVDSSKPLEEITTEMKEYFKQAQPKHADRFSL